jgi:hypothetical protein
MAFSYSPKIVTEGLVLYLDAANPYSYVSGSTSWNDISRGGNNGTLVNGPTFSSANNGSILFDGTNDYVDTAYIPPTTFSVSVWFKNDTTYDVFNRGILSTYKTGIGGPGFFGLYVATAGPSSPYPVSPAGLNLWMDGNSRQTIPGLNTGQWYNLCITSNGSQVLAYLDTTVVVNTSNSTTHQDVLTTGRSRFNTNYWLGNIAMTQLYSRALSAQEVLQNYNATKTRFGLT